MGQAIQSQAKGLSPGGPTEDESVLFSGESVLNLQKLIFAGSPSALYFFGSRPALDANEVRRELYD